DHHLYHAVDVDRAGVTLPKDETVRRRNAHSPPRSYKPGGRHAQRLATTHAHAANRYATNTNADLLSLRSERGSTRRRHTFFPGFKQPPGFRSIELINCVPFLMVV